MTMRLGHIDHMVHRHTYPEDHPKVKCGNSHFHNHAIVTIFGHHVETQFPCTHLSSYSIDTLPMPQVLSGNFWGFFWDVHGPCHFIEHLRYLCFSENLTLQSFESLSDSCFVELFSSLRTQWWKPCSIWCSELSGTRRCRSWRSERALSASCATLFLRFPCCSPSPPAVPATRTNPAAT